jgi:hypothetical protein
MCTDEPQPAVKMPRFVVMPPAHIAATLGESKTEMTDGV